jgi:hypothetical protein
MRVKHSPTKDVVTSGKYQWPVARLFGRNSWCAPWIMELCNADDKFSLHMIEQQEAYVHYLCVVRLALLDYSVFNTDIPSQAEWLRTHSKKAVLDLLYAPAPPGLLNILAKLGPYPLSQEYYQLILDSLPNIQVQKYLRHKKRINKRDLNIIPVLMSNNPSSSNWLDGNDDFERLKYYVRLTQRIDPDMPLEDAVRSLVDFRQQEQFAEWIEKQLLKASFPLPTWAGNDWIHPITTAADLKSTAQRFENCCYDYLTKILFDRCYFYVSDRGPALVMIIKDPFFGWELKEMAGPDNEKVDATTRLPILDAFAEVGIQPCGPFRWYDVVDDYLF